MVWIIDYLDTLSLAGDKLSSSLPLPVGHALLPVSELVLLWKQLRLRWHSSQLPETQPHDKNPISGRWKTVTSSPAPIHTI